MLNIVTVGHQRFDTRIWHKQIKSLASYGHEIRFFVADGLGDETVDNIEIIDLGKVPSRSGLFFRLKHMLRSLKVMGLNKGDLIHFHDGFFLPFAILLHFRGCIVIYDVHEDYPRQVLNMRFSPLVKKALSLSMSFLEFFAGRLFPAIVTATSHIQTRFPYSKSTVVNNFPLVNELHDAKHSFIDKNDEVAYVGLISKVRGIEPLIEAISRVEGVKLNMAGHFNEKSFEDRIKQKSGWSSVEEYGFVNRKQVNEILSKSKVGVVTFLPAPNHIEAQPNKLFEYMSAGLPVIASNFPLWREIVEKNNCGICVDPSDPIAISDAIRSLINNPSTAIKMGRNGRNAIKEKYNWDIEKEKLFEVYKKLLNSADHP